VNAQIIPLFLKLASESPKSNIESIILKISHQAKLSEKDVLRSLVYNLGTEELLNKRIKSSNLDTNQKKNIAVKQIISDFYSLAVKFGGEYRIKIELSSGWRELLSFLMSINYDDYFDLYNLLSNTEIEISKGTILEQFSLDESLSIISSYTDIDYEVIHKKWYDITRELMKNGKPFSAQLAKSAEILLENNKIISAIHASKNISKTSLRLFLYIDPPWRVFDYPCYSIGWRMGSGEDYRYRWYDFIDSLDSNEKSIYFEKVIPPEDWKEWFYKNR